MRSPVVFDGRNIYSPEQMRTLGFTYFSIGRLMPRTVLVTGGAGYIGSHAAKALSRGGLPRRRLRQPRRRASRGRRGTASSSKATSRDVGRRRVRRCDDTAIGAVMHFAAYLDVGESVRDPVKYYRNNVDRRAQPARRDGRASRCRPFVFSSTCATYGEPVETPIDETHPQRPINAYGETKLAVERALPHFERAYGIRSSALRYFNAAGCRSRTARSARTTRRRST